MKKLNIISALTVVLILLMACNKNKDKKIDTRCTFNYSGWYLCSNNVQTRTYTSYPSGCTGTPPLDSIQRSCFPPCFFVYSSWSLCSNNVQTRTYTSYPSGCTGTPPADSLQRACIMLITIGGQTWTLKNLDVASYRNGDPIPEVQAASTWSNLTTGAWCYYENNTANGTTYGKLYNWYAVNDPRGLAPNGYHIPTDAEWTTLTSYLGGTVTAGGKMKEAGTSHWLSPNTGATNSSGFTGLPGGIRYTDGGFTSIGAEGDWWSSSENGTSYASCRNLNGYNGSVCSFNFYKRNGFSVRCLRD